MKKQVLILLLCSLCTPATEAFACKHKSAAMQSASVSKENRAVRTGKHTVYKPGKKKNKKKQGKELTAIKDSMLTVAVAAKIATKTVDKRDIDAELLSWLTFMEPERETPNEGSVKGCVSLNGNDVLNEKHPYDNMNREVCAKIGATIRNLCEQAGTTITGVHVTGYSAPAGSVQKSEKAAAQRLLNLKDELRRSRATGKASLEAGWTSEDWDSLAVLVRQSDMPLHEAVNGIIQNTDPVAGREQTIARLAGGVPYAYMKERLYPKVERIEYSIDYRCEQRSNKQSGVSCEGGITLASLCATANGYAKDSKEFADLMDLSARLFPNSVEANINAGAVALLHKDTTRARKYMEKYATAGKALGNMGVLCLMEGNPEKAELYLDMAAAAGSAQAKKALNFLRKK